MKKLCDFITEQGITATATPQENNPNRQDDSQPLRHYLMTLQRGHNALEVSFSVGLGWLRAPTAEDVLACLASDAAGVENAAGNFAEWCDEYGYDEDSRKAERIFHTCERQAEELKAFLGKQLYEELLWETEH